MKKGLCVLSFLFFYWISPVLANELTDDYFDMATNYFNHRQYSKALEYLDFVLKVDPNNLKATFLKNKLLRDNLSYNEIIFFCGENVDSK